ncbi:MAG: hypothetical protein H7282_12430 [Cytophagaceae bacterium]|nr:hypothetical protein [Cytophagaceae bacterium]
MNRIEKISTFLLAVAILIGVFAACKRTFKDEEFMGTAVRSAPADFSGIIIDTEPKTYLRKEAVIAPPAAPTTRTYELVDENYPGGIEFGTAAASRVAFVNEFSHDVTWFLKISGRTSGAIKEYTGTSKKIDSNIVYWDGAADGTRFFIFNEFADYTLSFLGSSISYNGLLKIANSAIKGPKKYPQFSKLLPDGSYYTYEQIDNFDLNISSTNTGLRTSYGDAADGAGKAVFFVTDTKQVDGYFSYYMKGTDNNGNNYLGGASGELLEELKGHIKESDPSKVYVNAYIYGYGRPNSALFFQAFENDFINPDDLSGPSRNAATSDMWFTIVEVNWVGWKLVSIPYSSFKPASNPLSGGGGNRIKEPKKIVGFGIELESYPNSGGTAELALDVVVISTNGVFKP